MVKIQLTKEQKKCKHKILLVRASDNLFNSVKGPYPKAEIVCRNCEVVVARAGTVWINRPEAVRGIIMEHWPALIGQTRR